MASILLVERIGKKNIVDDWLSDGYHKRFYLAAFEDPEFALRTTERLAKEGEDFKIFYLPTACLAHHHPYRSRVSYDVRFPWA